MKCAKKGGMVKGDMETPKGDEPLKKGGAAKKKYAHGGAAKMRLDKRARGGKVNSPSHPLSGAAPSKMRPGFSESGPKDREDD
jgi:hypothetical protein